MLNIIGWAMKEKYLCGKGLCLIAHKYFALFGAGLSGHDDPVVQGLREDL